MVPLLVEYMLSEDLDFICTFPAESPMELFVFSFLVGFSFTEGVVLTVTVNDDFSFGDLSSMIDRLLAIDRPATFAFRPVSAEEATDCTFVSDLKNCQLVWPLHWLMRNFLVSYF